MKLLIYGITAGVLFGVLLQKARVLRYDKQLGALRLMDMTIVKFMLSSVLVEEGYSALSGQTRRNVFRCLRQR